jgi:hypothetical protein
MEPDGSSPHSQAPATCPILSLPSPVQTPTSHFPKIHLNIILPSAPGSPQWYLSPRFPHQNPVHASPFPHTRYMPRPSHSSQCYHPHNNGWVVQNIKLLIMSFSPFPCYLISLRPKYAGAQVTRSQMFLRAQVDPRNVEKFEFTGQQDHKHVTVNN